MAGLGVSVLDDVVSTDLVQREWQSLEQEYEHLEVSIPESGVKSMGKSLTEMCFPSLCRTRN